MSLSRFFSPLIAAILTAFQAASFGAPASGKDLTPTYDALVKAIQDNYPMLELVGWRDEWIPELRARVATAPDRESAYEVMDELVCRLSDYHTRFSWPDKPKLQGPPIRVEPVLRSDNAPADHGIWGTLRPPVEMPAIDGVAIAVVDAGSVGELRTGDEIVSVAGVPVRDALAKAWRHSVCSSVAGRLRSAAGRMLLGPPDSELELGIIRKQADGEKRLTIHVTRGNRAGDPIVSLQEAGEIPLIRITRWSNDEKHNLVDEFDHLLEGMKGKSAIILDVRGNGGGQDKWADMVVGRFLKEPIISSISFHRIVPGFNFERMVLKSTPRGPWRYEGRVAVLMDEGCMSSCEHFVSGMIEAGALACGTPTSGACGLIRGVDLPGGAHLNVSQTFPIHTGGIPSPELGMAPHIWAVRTLSDVRTGEDTALNAAIKWLRSNDPLPARFQPMTTFSR